MREAILGSSTCEENSFGKEVYNLPPLCQTVPRYQKANNDRISAKINKESNILDKREKHD